MRWLLLQLILLLSYDLKWKSFIQMVPTFLTDASLSIFLKNVAIVATAHMVSSVIFAGVVTATFVNRTLIVIYM